MWPPITSKLVQGFNTNTDLQTYLSTIKSEKDIRLLWQNKGKDDNTPIEFNGTPFVLLNKRLYTCHQGKDRNKEKNDKRKTKKYEEVVVNPISTRMSRGSVTLGGVDICPLPPI